MKIPLSYQITEYDCGTMAFINAISYLFERKEIPVSLIRGIFLYTLDSYNDKGNWGEGGTSREAVKLLERFINDLADTNKLDIKCKVLEGKQVKLKEIKRVIRGKGCVIVKCWQGGLHYVLVTDIDNEYVYIFDSYYLDSNYIDKDGMMEIVSNRPFKYNRKVRIERFMSKGKKDFALGCIKDRLMLSMVI